MGLKTSAKALVIFVGLFRDHPLHQDPRQSSQSHETRRLSKLSEHGAIWGVHNVTSNTSFATIDVIPHRDAGSSSLVQSNNVLFRIIVQ